MDVASLLLLLALAALGWFWFDSLSALEVARTVGKRVCRDVNVQFLDDTVANIGLALVRNKSGRRILRRTYRFEFSETGDSRLEGRMVVFGRRVESVTLEPYQILPQADASFLPERIPDRYDAYGRCCGGCGRHDETGDAEHESVSTASSKEP